MHCGKAEMHSRANPDASSVWLHLLEKLEKYHIKAADFRTAKSIWSKLANPPLIYQEAYCSECRVYFLGSVKIVEGLAEEKGILAGKHVSGL